MTKRAAAYCRVSTDKEDQLNSFESQKAFFSEYIARQSGWTLAGVYADEGITGTSALRRAGFLRMISDAHAGLLDVIITKEVSRFSRNILDAVAYTRELKALGVGVIFLNDGISTLDPDAELRLGIMASVAQEESRKTSQRVKWGQRRSMERGVVFGPSLLGYDVQNGQIEIEPHGAETVRTIYALYVYEKMGARAIADSLTRRGIPSMTGKTVWSAATVLKILKNEKYCGDLVQRKMVTTDYLTHRKSANADEDELVIIKNHHAPIISRSLWDTVQAERRRRTSSTAPSSGHGSRYALSGRIICAVCGRVFTCRTRKRQSGKTYRTWCGSCVGCYGARIYLGEEQLADCLRQIVSSAVPAQARDEFAGALARLSPDRAAQQDALRREIAVLEQKRIKLADVYLSGDFGREEYLTLKNHYENVISRKKAALAVPDDRPQTEAEMARLAGEMSSGRYDANDFYLGFTGKIEVGGPDAFTVFLKNHDGCWRVTRT